MVFGGECGDGVGALGGEEVEGWGVG